MRIQLFGDEVERICAVDPLTGEIIEELDSLALFPASHYITDEERLKRGDRRHRDRAARSGSPSSRASSKLLEAQRLRMRTTYDLEMLREVGSCSGVENYSMHLDGRVRHQPPYTLLDYFPDDWLCVRRRVARRDPAAARPVRGRPLAQGDARRARLPAAVGDGQPAAAVRGVHRAREPGRVPVGDAGRVRARDLDADRRAGRAPDRPHRSRGDRQADEGPDRRPRRRDQRARRGRPARARHDAHQEDVGGPHRLPARARHPRALPALRDRHARTHRDPAVAAARRVRRARRHQPAARRSRPARGVAGRDPRRRQGRLPALGDVADPDDRSRRRATSTVR